MSLTHCDDVKPVFLVISLESDSVSQWFQVVDRDFLGRSSRFLGVLNNHMLYENQSKQVEAHYLSYLPTE